MIQAKFHSQMYNQSAYRDQNKLIHLVSYSAKLKSSYNGANHSNSNATDYNDIGGIIYHFFKILQPFALYSDIHQSTGPSD